MTEFKNILIVRTDRIGDVVLTTPAIRALRQRFPDARISVLVTPFTKQLLDGNPDIDEILIDDRKGENKGPGGFFRLVSLLRSKKFDLAIIYHTKKRTNSLCFFAGIKERLGYENKKFGFFLTNKLTDLRHKGEKHEAQYCLDVLKAIGIETEETPLFLPVKQESEAWVDQFFNQNSIIPSERVIIIHAGASDQAKRWPEKYFAQIIDSLAQKYSCRFLTVGSSDIRKVSREITSLTREDVIDLTGIITLSQLISLLKRSNLLISNDSGPVHMAAAVNTPVISIFTRNFPGINPERWGPLSQKSQVVSVDKQEALDFLENEKISFEKSGTIQSEYLEIIKPFKVLESIDSLFKL